MIYERKLDNKGTEHSKVSASAAKGGGTLRS